MTDASELLALYSSAIGDELLAYVLALDVSEVPDLTKGEPQLDQARQSVVDDLRQITLLPLPKQAQEVNRRELLRALLMQPDERGASVARLLHLQAGVTEPSVNAT